KTAKDVADALTGWLKPKRARARKWWPVLAVAAIAAAIVLIVLQPFGGPKPPLAPAGIRYLDQEQAPIKPQWGDSMLQWKPYERSLTGSGAKLHWEAGKPMLVHCTDCGLVSLSKAKRPGYEVRVKIRQETWHGYFGVFLGYHHGKDAGGTFCEYQLIK